MADREEQRVEGCLLQAGILYPQKKVMLCGVCPNRSDMVGDLAEFCHVDAQE